MPGLVTRDLDLERFVMTVRQQLTSLHYKETPALTKDRRTRSVPLPCSATDLSKKYLATHDPMEGARTLESSVEGLLFYLREKERVNKNYFNTAIWLPSIKKGGFPPSRVNDLQKSRHFFHLGLASKWSKYKGTI